MIHVLVDQEKNLKSVMANNPKYRKENIIIQSIAKDAFRKYKQLFRKVTVIQTKSGPADVVSQMDLVMDRLLNRRIKKYFPSDAIFSEEGSGVLDQMIADYERVWVLDPICGSLNVKKGINIAATNVILLVHGEIKAAWVFDYPRERVLWSTGGRKVYDGNKKIPKLGKNETVWHIEASKGYLHLFSRKYQNLYGKYIQTIATRKYTYLGNSGSSLTFAYVATGQYQGAVAFYVKSWDLLAACFLVEQNNGIVRNFDGSEWGINSKSVIVAGNRTVYKALHAGIKKFGKQTIKKLVK